VTKLGRRGRQKFWPNVRSYRGISLEIKTEGSTKTKVKVTLVQALKLCTGRTAHRGSRGIALLFHDQRH